MLIIGGKEPGDPSCGLGLADGMMLRGASATALDCMLALVTAAGNNISIRFQAHFPFSQANRLYKSITAHQASDGRFPIHITSRILTAARTPHYIPS